MLKGCPQIYFSEVRHFSRCLLVVRYQTCHQTTYTCFCTQEFFETVSLALELIGVAIIVYGAIGTIIFLIKAEAKSVRQAGQSQYRIKQQFPTRILTGLEFFIAGDVLKTIINPTLESLAVVGAIVAIRTALTYLLNRELKDQRERDESRESRV
jgi:uncharacterized membrane protein